MDAQIGRHQPLITARLVFAPKTFSPPPIITARMEFPSISIPSLTPKKRHTTPKSTSSRYSTPRRDTTPKRKQAPESDMDVDSETRPKRASTPTIDTRFVAFEKYVDLGSPLSPLPNKEGDELESVEDGEVSKKIPKPPGEVGRPQSGGYNLQEKLSWNDKTYESIIVSL
jgi:hypothetical protein